MIAYFDESGKPKDKRVVSLCAVVAPESHWVRYDLTWMRAMRDFRSPMHPKLKRRYFHMTDFESPHQAPYKDWSKKKKDRCIQKLSSTLEKAIVYGGAYSLIVKEWEEIALPHLTAEYKERRGWYVFLLQGLLEAIAKYVTVPKHETIACIFDQNKEIGKVAQDHFEALKAIRGWERIFGTATYIRQ